MGRLTNPHDDREFDAQARSDTGEVPGRIVQLSTDGGKTFQPAAERNVRIHVKPYDGAAPEQRGEKVVIMENGDASLTAPPGLLTPEQAEVLGHFNEMLRSATADGGRKRAAGVKPSWKVDTSHEAAMFSHINKWKHGEKRDPDSGKHPLVHLAWRALAIAYQETVEAARAEREKGQASK